MTASRIPLNRFTSETRVVFFTGAGISAESGLATFRDPEGYWSKYDPMVLASVNGFQQDPELVTGWYAERRRQANQARPNAGHISITQFQKLFPNSVVITQNVDGLHARAGNDPVWELHGNIHRRKCFKCGMSADTDPEHGGNLESCSCGGLIRPDVVWFGESLPQALLESAFMTTSQSELFFSIGTSNQVYPAAQLPFEAKNSGAFVIEINPEETPFSSHADVSLRELAGRALPKLYEEFHVALSMVS